MNDATSAPEEVTLSKLVRDFKTVVQDAEGLVKATTGELGEKLGEKTREARVRLAASLESAKVSCHKMEERATAGARATDKVIREHPYESIGVAFGVGLLIGVLVTRR